MKKITISIIFLLVSIMLFAQSNRSNLRENISKYTQLLYLIDTYYLDTVKMEKLVDEAIFSTIKELDPHSAYITKEDVKAMSEPLEGEFEGIGIEFAIINDTLTVQATISGGPSETVGLLAGDKILAVDNEEIAGKSITNDKVFKLLRGAKGTKVALDVLREGANLEFVVVRDKIPLYSVDAAYFIQGGIYYIKLSRFAMSSGEEIAKALLSAEKPIQGVVLDLRGNAGGYLHTAIEIADQFLKKDQLIVYTEGRNIYPLRESATGKGFYQDNPLVVLIDENSASSSEIVAGAIQDWDRGILIGRRSFGKGLVQRQMELPDGSMVRLTVARYHTPSDRVIQMPYQKGDAKDYYLNHYKRYENGEMYSRDSIHFADSLKYKTLDKGRVVYGGGGIMPDIFVPSDTTSFSDFYANLLRKGVIISFINDYADKNRKNLSTNYVNIDKFVAKFEISDKMFISMIEYAKTKGIEPKGGEIEKSKSDMKLYMKALLSRHIFDSDTYYKVMNSDKNDMLNKAIDVINNWDKYSKEIYD